MATSRTISPSELLLQILEATSLGATSERQLGRQLRRAHPFSGLTQRIKQALATLEAEGLIEPRSDLGAGAPRSDLGYRATASGLLALERRGRFPGGGAVLFTDIVGSTELIDAFGEAGAHRRRQHHFSLLREAISSHGGREVKSLGDGLMVIFGDACAAAKCAAAMQLSVADDPDQLGLRVGLHSGELLREGDDFFGTTVIIARRLCESACAGQIVISDEICGALGEAANCQPLQAIGSVNLKGLKQPVAASLLLWSQASEIQAPASAEPDAPDLKPKAVV
ncbi:MAG: adenylate/guanylate cyclase domain-containing protein [Thermoleophilaceae bacterium]|nr:adenylate/guanylate cyclase domain-containing protein [Thermoleophilaceae bacterium]